MAAPHEYGGIPKAVKWVEGGLEDVEPEHLGDAIWGAEFGKEEGEDELEEIGPVEQEEAGEVEEDEAPEGLLLLPFRLGKGAREHELLPDGAQ